MSDSLTADQPQTIIFNEIPASRRDPDVLVEVRPNYRNIGLLGFPAKAIILSQMLAAGTAVPGQVYPITAKGQGGVLFGKGSIAAIQIALFLKNNSTTPLFAAAVADAAGATKATKSVVFGAVTLAQALSVTLKINGTPVTFTVPGGLPSTALPTAGVAAINALTDLPVTAAVDGTGLQLVITAKNGGLCGNEIDVRIAARSDATAPMLTIYADVATTSARATLAGGLGNPDASSLLSAISGTWYTDIILPWVDATNRGEIAAEGVRRYGAMVNLDARFYVGVVGTYTAVVNFGGAGNSIQMIQVGVRGQLEAGWCWAAVWGAIHAFRLANDPSRQSKGIAAVGLTAPADGDLWLANERDLLLNNGISTWTALDDGTVVIGRTITGYLQSTSGVADAAWLDVMTPAVMTCIRYDWKGYVKLVYPQSKLFDDDSVGAEYDDTAVTPRRMRGTWAARCVDYERAGWIEGTAETAQQGYFVRNPNDKNRLDQDVVVRTAGNLMIEATVLEFAA